jgi:hypothetical protein
MIHFILFLALFFTILSIRMLIVEILTAGCPKFIQYVFYIPTCIFWTWFYYLSD